MPDFARYQPMISAFLNGPNAQAGSDWRSNHPRMDQFMTNHPGFDFSQLQPRPGAGPRGGGGGGFFGGPRGDIRIQQRPA